MSDPKPDEPARRLRALSRGELAAAFLTGVLVFALAAIVLSPYPELLGNDRLGPVRWTWEFFKPGVASAVGAAACLAAILVMQRRRRK